MFDTVLKYNYYILLIIIGCSVLTVVNGLLHFDAQHIIYPDSTGYFEAAKNIYIYHSGHNYRPIVMAAINGFPYLFGCSDAFVYEFSFYINVFCWLATACVMFALLKQFLNEKMAFLFSLSAFFFVGTIAFVYHLLSENIYTFFIVVAFYFLLKYYTTKSFWPLSVALSVLILSMLVRPGSKWLAILFLLFYIKELLRHYKNRAAWMVYASLLLVIVQCAGIRYQFGNFTISYIDSVTYYNYLGSKAMALKEGRDFGEVKNERGHYIYSLSGPEIKQAAFDDLVQQLKANKSNLIKAYLLNLYENTTSGNAVITDTSNRCNENRFEASKLALFTVSRWQNILFTMMGVIAAFYFLLKRKDRFFRLMSVFVVYTVFISGISSEQGDRFDVVIYPFVLVLLAILFFGKPGMYPSQLQEDQSHH